MIYQSKKQKLDNSSNNNSEEQEWRARVKNFGIQRKELKHHSVSVIKSIASGEKPLFSKIEAEEIFSNLRLKGYESQYTEVLLRNISELSDWIDPNKEQYISEFFCIIKPKEVALRAEKESQENHTFDLQRKTDFDSFEQRLSIAFEKHQKTLLKKRRQILWKNDYGFIKGFDKWIKEVSEFINDVVRPPVYTNLNYEYYADLVNKWLGEDLKAQHNSNIKEMSGQEFEFYCCNILANAGWTVTHNGKAGDQGVDLISVLNDTKVAIQCKRYGNSVGNKAVQEIYSGKNFEECDIAVVVSNAKFTASAVQLARTLGVLLIDVSELHQLDQLILKNQP